MNSKEENSTDFCPNYVQEFGLSLDNFLLVSIKRPIYIIQGLQGPHRVDIIFFVSLITY
jgi:hypothetical protein